MLLALLTLTACLPAPDPDWTLDDTGPGEGEVDGIEFSGKLFYTTESGPPLDRVVVGLVYLADAGGDLEVSETIQQTAPFEGPADSKPADFELVLPEEPDGDMLYTFDQDLLGAPFLLVSWEESGAAEGYDADDVLVGTSETVLVYLRGQLSSELEGDGLQEGWNQMDFGYWMGGPPNSVGPVVHGSSVINLDTNLLPELPSSLSGELDMGGDVGGGHEDLMVAAVTTKGFCGSPYGYSMEALSTTGTTGTDFNYAQWPGLADFDKWETNDVAHECGDVPEDRLLDTAVFYLVAFFDTNGDRGFDPEVDGYLGDSAGAGDESSFIMYTRPRSPLAYLHTLGEGNMGWSRIRYTDGSPVAWNGAVIGNDWGD